MRGPPAKLMVGAEIIPERIEKRTNGAARFFAEEGAPLLAGFQTHLAKPVEPDDLIAVILSLKFKQEL